jgi:hypothetical protein
VTIRHPLVAIFLLSVELWGFLVWLIGWAPL